MIYELVKNIIVLKVPIKIKKSFKDKEGIYVINMLKYKLSLCVLSGMFVEIMMICGGVEKWNNKAMDAISKM